MSNEHDLRYIRTNKLLINAFSDLLRRKNFDDITINELCESALVRRATFYTHFIDKYDFFSYFVRKTQEDFIHSLPSKKDCDHPDTYFFYMTGLLIHFFSDNLSMVKNIQNSNSFPILLSIVTKQINSSLLENIKATRPISGDDMADSILASFYSGGLIQIIQDWLGQADRISEEEMIAKIGVFLNTHPIITDN